MLEISSIVPGETRTWVDIFLKNFKIEHLNTLSKYVEEKIIGNNKGDLRSIELINNGVVQIGREYCHFKGHELEKIIKEKFTKLKSFNNDGSLVKGIIDRTIKIFPEFLPKSSLNMLIKIQKD